MTDTRTTPDLGAIKATQRVTWQMGDYPRVGNTLQTIAERLVEAAEVHAGTRVLDVASGQGNAALAAARRFAEATGVDYAPNLLEQGRARAAAEHLPVTFVEGDAEELPFADGTFDTVLSTVGVMFAPDHQKSADELVRVTRRGGTIALASWTPSGMVGHMFKAVGKWAPPPAGLQPPVLWGTTEHLEKLFGDRVEWTALTTREFDFAYHSPEHFSAWFREFYGPTHRVAGGLTGEDLERYAADLAEVARSFNRASDGTVLAGSEYLEAVGVVR